MSEPVADEARAQRLAQLETRLSKKPSVGVVPPVAALALVCAVVLLFMQRADFEYFFSPKTPIDLGTEGAYHFENAEPNRYVQIHGTPDVRGVYWLEGNRPMVAIGVRDTQLLLQRPTLSSENWSPGKVPPQPNQQPFAVKGRLLSRAMSPKIETAFRQIEMWGQEKADWVLIAEEHPGQNTATMVLLAALVAFAATNAWLLVRGLMRFGSK